MSNKLRQKSKKNKRHHRQYNSWAFVIFASLIDTIFRIGGKYSPGKSIFDLSSSLGPRGRKRQELLAVIFLGLIDIAFIAITVALIVTRDSGWKVMLIITLLYSLFWGACLIEGWKIKNNSFIKH